MIYGLPEDILEKAKTLFGDIKSRYLTDNISPKVDEDDKKLDGNLELLRSVLLFYTYSFLHPDYLKKGLQERYKEHDLSSCPILPELLFFTNEIRNDVLCNHIFDYGLKYLYEIKDYLPKDILARHIVYHYISNSHPILCIGCKKLVEMMESCKRELKELVMDEVGKKIFTELPEKVKIYRGMSHLTNHDIQNEFIFGVSWALNINEARGFAHGKRISGSVWGYLLEGEISKEDIFLIRCPTGESQSIEFCELLVNPFKMKNIKVLEAFEPIIKTKPPEDKTFFGLEGWKEAVRSKIKYKDEKP